MGDWEDIDWDTVKLDPNAESGDNDKKAGSSALGKNTEEAVNDGEDWLGEQQQEEEPQAENQGDTKTAEGEPMIIVDLTLLTKGKIHSKFDRNSVNDPDAAREWRLQIESKYEDYCRNSDLLSNKTVIPASTSVWR